MTGPLEQLTAADLAGMSPQQIVDAREAGKLARLLGVSEDEIALLDKARTGVINNADAGALNRIGRHDLVNTARADGRVEYTHTTED